MKRNILTHSLFPFSFSFLQELWAEEVKTNLVPQIIKAHLAGNTSALKPWLGEAVYNKLAADIRTRKHDGIVFDTNILDIDENQILVRFLENNAPVIVVVYMVQQINCIRNRKGEIIEVRFNLLLCVGGWCTFFSAMITHNPALR